VDIETPDLIFLGLGDLKESRLLGQKAPAELVKHHDEWKKTREGKSAGTVRYGERVAWGNCFVKTLFRNHGREKDKRKRKALTQRRRRGGAQRRRAAA
jgi:hypothetical protein